MHQPALPQDQTNTPSVPVLGELKVMENHSNDFSYSFVFWFSGRKVIDYMLDLI